MNGADIEKGSDTATIHGNPDEDTLWGMVRQFYCRRMLSFVILVWVWFLILLVPTIYSGMQFFKTDETKFQIMHAAIFVCCIHFLMLLKIFAWQMIHRNSILGEIRRLNGRVAELQAALGQK